MKKVLLKKQEIDQTEHEEFLNSVSHGLGLFLSLLGSSVLLYNAIQAGNYRHIIGVVVFGVAMIFLYGSSLLYHSAKAEEKKKALNLLDHCAIYIFIAGTYTLVLLTLTTSSIGYVILTLQWLVALLGIFYKAKNGPKSGVIDSLVYALMGWMFIFFYETLSQLPETAIQLIVYGGICYTVGIAFFLMDHKYRYFHTVWHFLVIAGTFFHFLIGAIYAT